ncbi:MAG: TAT-variant-translocated molybdopterin oxidoreductase [Oligoflexia bacterium]|nr:TAT-variant-translocated molybdopterin oxidoreductase [Oligoflexia bacterium]
MESNTTDTKYWTKLSEFSSDPTFIQKAQGEFVTSPLQKESNDSTSRRDFMKLMAASSALASSACFPQPFEKIMPYVNQPADAVNGKANYYASTCGECAAACGILVKTREGRPIKLEGNPDHPLNRGGLCAVGQSSILNLYDPDRLRNPVFVVRGSGKIEATDWDSADKKALEKLKATKSGVRFLTGPNSSPTRNALINDFLGAFSGAKHVVYDSSGVSIVAQGQQVSYGTAVIPRLRFEDSEVILSIDADFLGTWLSPVEFTKQFSKNRKVSESSPKMSKLICFESVMTVTGANADERVAIRSEHGAAIALSIAHELITKHGFSAPGDSKSIVSKFSPASVAESCGISADAITKAAQSLAKSRGKSLVLAGSTQSVSQNGLSLQVAANFLNSILGNDGLTVDSSQSPSQQTALSVDDIATLISDMKAGKVKALLIHGVNPAYDLPDSLGFKEAASKVDFILSFSDRADETAVLADMIMPDNHPLESWGDAEPQKGVFSLRQPTIRPIYSTRAMEDSLISLSKGSKLGSVANYHDYLVSRWQTSVYRQAGGVVAFDLFWESALRDGIIDVAGKSGARKRMSPSRVFKTQALSQVSVPNSSEKLSLTFYQKVSLGTGRSANNPWLQELPDPLTRIVWDNYATLSPKTAKALNTKEGDVVRISTDKGVIELPIHVQPGMHDKSIGVALGYGRTHAGSVGSGVGKSVSHLTDFGKAGVVLAGIPATVTKTGAKYRLASAQENQSLEGRPIIREATLGEYKKNPKAGNEDHAHIVTLWPKHEYKGYRWAMNIDLTACTGCQGCVIGCQSENNIPVVGKENVWRGRIMHWIRIDRYYSGSPDRPQVVHQPMLCQHCENAPCETVCPVLATVHSDEGLNSQIYNRCVGTRYCANNCPYKVRRFNWFDFNYGDQMKYPQTLAQNPEVSVRSRGVMEKCTFCVQRIQDVKNTAKDEGRLVKDGEIQTACQQSCPADAISFGNINDTESQVAELKHNPRSFHVLEELNTQPSVTYLTKIRNVEHV